MTKKFTTEEYITKCREKYGDKYDYSKVEYKGSKSKVTIICPKHGEFQIRASNFLQGHECNKCGIEHKPQCKAITKDEFIEKAKQIYGDKYDYSKVDFINSKTPVTIICPKHGEFKQIPYVHLNGHSCPYCAWEKQRELLKKNNSDFTEEAKKIHGDKYDYSKVEYVNNKTKITIICPKHGEFKQTPSEHLRGFGCPICKSSHLERDIRELLKENHIVFEEQKRFDWLGLQSLDFYIPSKKIAIECQGKQHFKPLKFFGGINGYMAQKERDTRKEKLCRDNCINLLYYAEKKYNNDDKIIIDKSQLLEKIVN